ncbi:NYN domain-containing protein [Nonomuraea pusilla]|uniref:NYN domain-containing protein n=1 Tax=Nonomuraea pusilla TaxID=46177 RepID=UPI00331E5BB9
MDRCALFVDAGYLLADGAMAVHGTRHREAVSWDYPGLLQLMSDVSRERTGLPLLRCYWYEATVEGRRTPEHDALADLPGLKLRLSRIRPGRREGVDAQVHRDLMTLARNNAICDAVVVSGDEDLAQVVCDAQDLGIRVTVVNIASDDTWAASRTLRQECDDLVELGGTHLRPYVSLVSGAADPSNARQPVSNGHATHSLPPASSSTPMISGSPSLPSSSLPDSLPSSLPGSLPAAGSSGGGSHAAPSPSSASSSPDSSPSPSPSSSSPSSLSSSQGHGGTHSGSSGGAHSGSHAGSRSGSHAGGSHSGGHSAGQSQGSHSAGLGQTSSSDRSVTSGLGSSSTPPALPSYSGYQADQPSGSSPSSAPVTGPVQSGSSSGSSGSSSGSPSTGQFAAQSGSGGYQISPSGSGAYQSGQPGNGTYQPSQSGSGGYQVPQPGSGGYQISSSGSGAYSPAQLGPYTGPQPAPVSPPPAATSGATTLADAVKAAHREGHDFGESVARDAPALWLEAVLARKPRMPSDLEARLLQGSSLPIDFLLHDEVRHALRRGFWDALERARH